MYSQFVSTPYSFKERQKHIDEVATNWRRSNRPSGKTTCYPAYMKVHWFILLFEGPGWEKQQTNKSYHTSLVMLARERTRRTDIYFF